MASYTRRSPRVERYLNVKLPHPTAVYLVGVGTFWQAFFEDAALVERELDIAVRDLAADSAAERIYGCAGPRPRLAT